MKVSRLALVLLCALLLWAAPGRGEEEPDTPSSELPRRCGVCHLDRVPEAAGGRVSFLSLRKAQNPGEEGICYSCHNGLVRDSRRSIFAGRQHRADGEISKTAPGQRASCGTCHDPHVRSEGVGIFMRFAPGASGHCLRCHPGRSGTKDGEHPFVSGGEESRRLDAPNCGTCHRVHRAAGKGLINRSSPTDLCGRCHGENPSRKGTGPGMKSHPVEAGVPTCSSCHTMHRAPEAGLVKDGLADSTLCLECHKARAGRRSGDGNHPHRSGKVECLVCHRLHNADSPADRPGLLTVDARGMDAVCRECHAGQVVDKGEWNHPVGVPAENTTVSRLAKLASYGGLMGSSKRVQCLTCHRSHGALKGTAGLVVSRQALCLYCHNDQNSLAPKTARFGTHPVSVKPRRASISKTLLAAGGKMGDNGVLVCTTCHLVHHAKEGTAGLVLSAEDYACTLCHTEKGEIVETAHASPAMGGDGEGGGKDPCRGCHGSHGWNIDLDAVEMGGSTIEKVCWSCHGPGGSVPMSGFFGHVIGIPPTSGTGGRDLPLFWSDGRRLEQGMITCATCHDVHRDPTEHFLRISPDETWSEICFGCHRKQRAVQGTKHDISLYFPGEKNRIGSPAKKTGPCGACHLVHSEGMGKAWARDVQIEPGQHGALGAFCADCHREGSFAQGKIVTEQGHPSPDILNERPEATIVDCDGCHDPHLWNPAKPSDKGDFFASGDGSNSFLVTPSGPKSPLCQRCHADQFTIAGTGHDFSESVEGSGLCEKCHVPHGGNSLLQWASPLPAEGNFGSGTCMVCHIEGSFAPGSAQEGFNHPVGVSPGPQSTEDLPLFTETGRRHPRGMVSCGTCHNPHRWSSSEDRSQPVPERAGPTTSFLRLPADGFSPLCFPCHANRSMVVGTDHDLRVTSPESVNLQGDTTGESGVCGACHRMHGSPNLFALWNRGLGKGEDPQSRYCRSCHDEGVEKDAKKPPRPEVHLVAYPGKGMVSRTFTQREGSLLDMSSTFTLYDRQGERKNRGFISCATCHDVHRWEPDTTRSGTGTPIEGDQKNSFLKVRNTFAVGRSFCKECHGDNVLEVYRTYHTSPPEAEEKGGKK